MAANPLDEFGRIARFFRPLAANFPGALALTDDAAIVSVPAGRELVLTTDAIVAGVHFLPTDKPDDIARKALRVNLSDLAAKGAQPLAYTLTLALGREVGDAWVESFAAALGEDQAHYGIALAGGDSVSTDGPIWISITAFGLIAEGKAVLRSGAKPGDRVYVSGTIGDAALGLAMLQDRATVSAADRAALIARYRRPEPRNGLAAALAEFAHAAIDVSDGLAADFGHLCLASGIDGVIDVPRVPLSPAGARLVSAEPSLWPTILAGGDDYEILLTVPPAAAPALRAAAEAASIPLTEIGVIEAGTGRAILRDAAGKPLALAKTGWTHA